MSDKNSKIKVLFVCLGNICRSPMAEAIFANLVKSEGIAAQFSIDSAGTSGYHEGEDYHVETRAVVKQHGFSTIGKSRPVVAEDFLKFDYILAMDSSNYSDLLAMCPNEAGKKKVSRMLEYSKADFVPGYDVPDPYYGGRDGFERVYDLLDDACRGFLEFVLAERSPK